MQTWRSPIVAWRPSSPIKNLPNNRSQPEWSVAASGRAAWAPWERHQPSQLAQWKKKSAFERSAVPQTKDQILAKDDIKCHNFLQFNSLRLVWVVFITQPLPSPGDSFLANWSETGRFLGVKLRFFAKMPAVLFCASTVHLPALKVQWHRPQQIEQHSPFYARFQVRCISNVLKQVRPIVGSLCFFQLQNCALKFHQQTRFLLRLCAASFAFSSILPRNWSCWGLQFGQTWWPFHGYMTPLIKN